MTAEHLMNAMGLLDDDLIQEAEQIVRSRRRIRAGRWLGLAASLALVIVLGYGAAHTGLIDGILGSAGNASGGAAPMAPAGSGPASSVAGADLPDADAESGDGLEDPSGPEEQSPVPEPLPGGSIHLEQDAGVYLLTGATAGLPEGAVPLGVLSALSSGGYPATSAEDYVGLELWAEGDGALPDALYVQLPDGRYAAAERVEP